MDNRHGLRLVDTKDRRPPPRERLLTKSEATALALVSYASLVGAIVLALWSWST